MAAYDRNDVVALAVAQEAVDREELQLVGLESAGATLRPGDPNRCESP